VALAIGEPSPCEEVQIDHHPDSKSTECAELQYPGANFANVKTVDTEESEEHAKYNGWNQAFLTRRIAEIPFRNRQSGFVLKTAAKNENEIDQRPNTEASCGEEVQNARADLADVKPMNSEEPQAKTQHPDS